MNCTKMRALPLMWYFSMVLPTLMAQENYPCLRPRGHELDRCAEAPIVFVIPECLRWIPSAPYSKSVEQFPMHHNNTYAALLACYSEAILSLWKLLQWTSSNSKSPNSKFRLIRNEAAVQASLPVNPRKKSLANSKIRLQHRLIRSDSSIEGYK